VPDPHRLRRRRRHYAGRVRQRRGRPTPAATSTGSASLSAFDTCLKAHGVKVTPRAFQSGGVRPTAFPSGGVRPTARHSGAGGFGANGKDSAAFKACAKYEPAGFGRGGNFGGTISASALAAFKSCMSQNGVTITGTTTGAIFSQMRTATGKTATALKTCRPLLQLAAPTPSPTTT